MQANELLESSDVVLKLADLCGGFHPDHSLAHGAIEMRLLLLMAATYLGEVAYHVGRGESTDDALLKVLEGKTPLPEAVIAAIEQAQRSRLN